MTSTLAELFDPTGLGKSIDQADSPNYSVQKTLIKVATDHFVRFGYRKATLQKLP